MSADVFVSAPSTAEACEIQAIVTLVPVDVLDEWFGADRMGLPLEGQWPVRAAAVSPGTHAAVICEDVDADLVAVQMRLAGWEIRDSLFWLRSDCESPRWIVLLGRAPLAGTIADTVLLHGTGAINVDACRVKTSDKLGGGAEKETTREQKTNEGWTRPWMDDESARARHAETVRANVAKAEELGRWPTNLLLTHAVGCSQIEGVWVCSGVCLVNEFASSRKDNGGTVTRYFPQFPAGVGSVWAWLTALVTPEGVLAVDVFGDVRQ